MLTEEDRKKAEEAKKHLYLLKKNLGALTKLKDVLLHQKTAIMDIVSTIEGIDIDKIKKAAEDGE